jgi:ribonuclease G
MKLKPKGYGVIVRTNASGKTSEDFIDEINTLYKKSEKILETSKYLKAPALVYKDSDIVYRAVRDLFSEDIAEFVINDISDYESVKTMAAELSENFISKVKLYDKPMPIFEYYSLESQIEKALQKHVWLKSGGFLIIEQTEACVVIDVNTGKFTGKKNLQETVFKTNKEAAVEIAKQMRLRNLSGMIIIDFIDMESTENQKCILELLEAETKKDRIRTVVVGITQLGLVQVTRKKMREPLSNILLSSCPCCRGLGKVISMQSSIQKLEQEIITTFEQTVFNQITVHATEELITAFSGQQDCYSKEIEARYNKKIIFVRENNKVKTYYFIEKKKV